MPTIGTNLSGPPLNASGSDPSGITPPPPPPTDASNHPDDQARGLPGEMQAVEQAAITNARTGKDQEPPLEESTDPRTEAPTEPAVETKPPVKPVEERTIDDVLADDKTPGWQKREIAKERSRRREETEARTKAEARVADLEAKLAAAIEAAKPPPPPKPEIAPDPPRPTRDKFETPDAYDAAMDAWGTEKATLAAARATEQARTDAETKAAADKAAADKAVADKATAEAEAKTKADLETLQKTWTTQRDAAIAKYPDYAAVAESDTLAISPTMAHAAIQSENGAEVVYHLGKNPDEAARIAALPDLRQVIEIGRLSQRLATPPQTRVEFPSDPITPLRSSREAATDTDREESMDEVAARVAKRETERRTGMWGQRTATH